MIVANLFLEVSLCIAQHSSRLQVKRMADFVSPEKRSKIMRGVKQADTKPEIRVRRALHAMGYRFRLHRKDLPGRPDIVLPRHHTALMVHGCFWHQHANCKDGRRPTSNTAYWSPKLERNVERDQEKMAALEALGWSVLTIWECETKDPSLLRARLEALLGIRKTRRAAKEETARQSPLGGS
jgi:DNA mismatch endonuclease (patch repair protein)